MTLWIVVADRSRARVLAREGVRRPLREVMGFTHPKGRLARRDFVADRPGRVRTTPVSRGVSAIPPHTDPKDVEAGRFAADLASALRHARERGDFGQLALVAPSRFLGELEEHLDRLTRQSVVAKAAKELTGLALPVLDARLKDVLAAAGRTATAPGGS